MRTHKYAQREKLKKMVRNRNMRKQNNGKMLTLYKLVHRCSAVPIETPVETDEPLPAQCWKAPGHAEESRDNRDGQGGRTSST